jgi:acetate kinase
VASILSINGGSSSLKFANYRIAGDEQLMLSGSITRIGSHDSQFHIADSDGHTRIDQACDLPDHASAVRQLGDWLAKESHDLHLDAVGHRIVHGGAAFSQPIALSGAVLTTLTSLMPLAPEHLPQELAVINAISQLYPLLPQILCFDTAFHHTLPAVARQYALPSRFGDAGIVRYGFHGLSYESILHTLRQTDRHAANQRLLVAHLGNGASMAAIEQGRSVETTMGFTPTGGLVMSTRTGDLDPGVLLYMIETLGLDPAAVRHLVSHEAGLLGISGSSGDVGDLLREETTNARAAAALAMFCYQARKSVGGLVAVLGGIDTLVFTGGIGEHVPAIRARICAGLEHLGIRLAPERNAHDAPIISHDASQVTVRVLHTNEELVIARHTAATLATRSQSLET